ncbi:MAG: hypothetical protein HYS57_00560 [Parcubacteria group bacterium]|nr:hypothetical protein [Parcubacteria group bacterium]
MKTVLAVSLVLVIALLATVTPLIAEDWIRKQAAESVYVGNHRVLRVAALKNMPALARVAIIHQRLAILQGDYPQFDPSKIVSREVVFVSTLVPLDYNRSQRTLLIGYIRQPGTPPFPGEEGFALHWNQKGAKDVKVAQAGDSVKVTLKPVTASIVFIPIVTIADEDARLHRTTKDKLAKQWVQNLRSAFASTR